VPDEQYLKHKGLFFLLNQLKYTKLSGASYDLREDYFGFSPNKKNKSYDIKPLPKNYDDYDVIYLADSHGVYEEDLPWVEKERESSRSKKVYGGLEEREWLDIVNRLVKKEKSLFIAEYNAFASPTERIVRESMTNYLGVNWSGWLGRYFDELNFHKNKEIPQWIITEFGETWDYSGPGFILVNDIDFQVLVLEMFKHVADKGIHISFTQEGKHCSDLKTARIIPTGLIL
jgi:hypothetical protein